LAWGGNEEERKDNPLETEEKQRREKKEVGSQKTLGHTRPVKI